MKLNRIVSIVLSLMLIFSAVTVPSFAEEAEAEAEVYGAESIGILSALGIAEIPAEELVDNIKRADFLKIMSIVAGYGETKSTAAVFADLPVDDEREPYLRSLYNLGIIAPDSKGNINPDTEIGMAEAAAIAVKVTGYSLVAESRGGYPSGYMSVAKIKDLLKGLPTSQYTVVTKGMAAKLAENALKADLMVQTGFGNDVTYEETKGKNLLYTVFSVKCVEDVLNGVDISRVMGENDVDTFYVEIDGLKLETRKVQNIYSYLGYAVKAYYSDERGDIPRLIWIEKTDKNTEVTIDIDDISYASATKIKSYDDSNKEKNYSLKKGLPVIYNGVSTGQSFGQSLITGVSGTVRLLDNTGDNAYDVIFVDAYETIIVAQVDTKENIVYDKYNSAKKVTLDIETDDPYTVIYDETGKEIKLSKLSAGDVLAVFSSAYDAYQGYINVYKVDNTVAGTIEKTSDSGKKLYIEGVEYEVKDNCITKFGHFLKPGQPVRLKLDYNGKVVWAEKAEDLGYQYGFIAAAELEGGLSGKFRVKMYTLNNMFEIFNGAKSVTVDGKKYDCDDTEILTKLKAASAAMFSGVDASCTASMVRYMLNASGEICAIDTMLNYNTGALGTREDTITGTNDALFVTTLSSAKYRQTYMVIGPKAAFTATSVVFFYPDPTKDDVDDEDNYETGIAKNLLTHETVYNGYAYFTDPTVLKTGFLGIPVSFVRDKSIAESSKFSVVDEVYKVYDQDNDDILDCVRFITSSGSAEVMVKDSKKNCVKAVDNEDEELLASNMPVTGLKRGDVVAYTTDIKGYLSSVTLYLRIDGSENQLVQGVAPGSTWWASRTQRYGFVYEKYDDGMLVYFASTLAEVEEARKRIEGKDSAKPITADECELVSFTSASPAYYSWEADRDGDMVAKASSQGALKSYKDTGTDCSLIYMQQNYGAPMAIMILE